MTPGSTAPEVSRAIPVIALCAWARLGKATRLASTANATLHLLENIRASLTDDVLTNNRSRTEASRTLERSKLGLTNHVVELANELEQTGSSRNQRPAKVDQIDPTSGGHQKTRAVEATSWPSGRQPPYIPGFGANLRNPKIRIAFRVLEFG